LELTAWRVLGLKKVEDNIKTKDMSVDELISSMLKDSSSTLTHISELRRYFDPFLKRIGKPKREHK
jgi:hypothetical protein